MLEEGYGILVLEQSRLCINRGSRSALRAVVTPGEGLKEIRRPDGWTVICCSLSGEGLGGV